MELPIVSLLHATRGRPTQALSARDLWLTAAEKPHLIEHVFAVDSDDVDSNQALSSFRKVVVEQNHAGCVAAWNLAARCSQGGILVQMSDDWLPIWHWDSKIAARFRDVSKPGVLRVSDGRRVDDLLCMAIFTRSYLELLGGDFLGSEYFGVYSDDEFSFRAYQNGVVIDARDILFEHCHPSFSTDAVYDEIYRRQNDERRFLEGRAIFLARNPSARGHWLHEGTHERLYLPPGHAHAFNTIALVVPRQSPVGRNLNAAFPQAGDEVAQSKPGSGINKIARSVARVMKPWKVYNPNPTPQFKSSLWPSDAPRRVPYSLPATIGSVPIYILSFNQPTYLDNMVNQLRRLEVACDEIYIIDNASTYPKAVAHLAELERSGIRVLRLERNFGPHGIFAPESGIHWPPLFALTDPDLQLNPSLPKSFREDMLRVAAAHGCWKCGMGLSIQLNHQFKTGPYMSGLSIEEWEANFWKSPQESCGPIASSLELWDATVYNAIVDTTFAVYMRDCPHRDFLDAVRVSGVFEAEHIPWYNEKSAAARFPVPDPEESGWYKLHAGARSTIVRM